jgi:hypothetical protein
VPIQGKQGVQRGSRGKQLKRSKNGQKGQGANSSTDKDPKVKEVKEVYLPQSSLDRLIIANKECNIDWTSEHYYPLIPELCKFSFFSN